MTREPLINKTMDRADLDSPGAREVCEELNELIRRLRVDGLRASSWYGKFDLSRNVYQRVNRGYGYEPLPGAADDLNYPWFLYWEIAWLVTNNDLEPGERVLDMGGASSLFSYYMASKGLEVTTVDLKPELVENANRVAQRTGWRLASHVMDMREITLAGPFDHITSVCVFEHIPLSGRIEVTSRIRELLREGGTFSITFDYKNPSRDARISSPEDIQDQFVRPSGLRVRGNRSFEENGKNYLLGPFFHPLAWRYGWKPRGVVRRRYGLGELFKVKRANDYTFGALFMERRDPAGA
jgi:2-polyprenyl-3-methyl-5-hydroxy-6-metoxy-1,4-benzoquinol methylase